MEALRSPEGAIRAHGVKAWAEGNSELTAVLVAQWARDPDPRVRVAAIQGALRRRVPGCDRWVIAATEDQDLQVRIAAIAALGDLGSAQAKTVLQQSLADRGELIRRAAVSSLAKIGDEELVVQTRSDPSWRVRLEVARALALYRDRSATVAAGELLGDPSPAVQLQVVQSVGQWPLRQSGPILLEALGKDTYQTRRAAWDRLLALWSPAAEFPVDGKPHERAEALDRLREQFQRELPTAEANVRPRAGEPRR